MKVEFINQNSFRLNHQFYASLGEKEAFVLSHARNLLILKIVGYAELVAKYYLLDNFKAHGWIAHQRYPTKGRVWHPGGAHPFIGMHEALVHNGDFANYHSITEYLRQYNIHPQFLTDTEVSVNLFDLWSRNFGYPLEYIIEAMAPTTEHDFDRLPEAKQRIYRLIQQNHVHSSPDGPWFFIIARNDVYHQQFQLVGITDTAMLRPQVFAIEDGEVQIGLICSEKQAIDATLKSLAAEDKRFCPVADHYWNARGGSSSDGGAFIFTVKDTGKGDGSKSLSCTNKFGEPVRFASTAATNLSLRGAAEAISKTNSSQTGVRNSRGASGLPENLTDKGLTEQKQIAREGLASWDLDQFQDFCSNLVDQGTCEDAARTKVIAVLSYLNDMRLPTGAMKRSWALNTIRQNLAKVFKSVPGMNDNRGTSSRALQYRRLDWSTRQSLRAPEGQEKILVIDAEQFPPEGDDCDARLIIAAYKLGWKQFVAYGYKGQRFCGSGLGQNSQGVRIDVYDSSGDYLASTIKRVASHKRFSQVIQAGSIDNNTRVADSIN